jgi:hypothetical protein
MTEQAAWPGAAGDTTIVRVPPGHKTSPSNMAAKRRKPPFAELEHNSAF